ncbi:MAG: hypothetical protein R3C19_01210 [Planctomycetaceae bacterium]
MKLLLISPFGLTCVLTVFSPIPAVSAEPDGAGKTVADSVAVVETDAAVETPAAAAETYLLRYRFQDGQVLRYKTDETMTMQAMVGSNRKEDVTRVRQTRRFRIEELNEDGSATVAMQFEHVRMELRANGGDPVIFDSSMAPNEVPATFRSAAHSLRQAAPRFVVETTGIPLNSASLADAPGDNTGEDEQGAAETPATAGFAIPLPDHPVAVGETWKTFLVVKLRSGPDFKRKVNLLQTYRLTGVDDGIATIEFSTSVVGRLTPLEKGQLLQATPKGTATFDIAAGRLLTKELIHDSTVFDAMGPNTLVTSVGRHTDRLLTDSSTEPRDDDVASDETPVSLR